MSRSLKHEVQSILAVSVAALALSPAALAQESQAAASASTVAEQEEDSEIQEVVVTGSRIKRNEYSSPSPITVITAERSQLAGLLSTEEILRNTTAASGEQINDSFSGFITDGGPGSNTISLRGLGAQRTLVLVNGKRWSPSGVQGLTNSVDLTAIPSSIIGRVEILKDGASSIYGADAVAGVINVITKESFDGLQISTQGLATDDGGGERVVFDASYGKVFDRGSISISVRADEQKELVAADRDWSSCALAKRYTDQAFSSPPSGVPVGDGVIDNSDPVTGEPLCFGFIYGLASTALGFLRYEPSLTGWNQTGNAYFDPRVNNFRAYGSFYNYTRMPVNGLSPTSWPLLPGGTGAGGSGNTSGRPIRPLYDNEGAFYRDTLSENVAQLQTPRELYSVTSLGQFDFDFLGGTSTAFYEAYWNKRETESAFGYRQFFPVYYPVTWEWLTDETGEVPFQLNPFNPFSGLAFLAGLSAGIAQPVVPSWNIQDPTSYVDIERYNAFAGLKGDLVGDWDYELNVGYGRSKGTYQAEQWLDDRVFAATNRITTRSDGSVTCDDSALAEFADCVPLNLWTEDALLRGIIPAEALAFISKMTEGTTIYEGKSVSAFATGSLFELPAGSVKSVLGAEFREESIDDTPDIEAQNNNFWGFSSAGITRGTDRVTEVFGEVEIPLLTGKRYAENLFVSASGRWTDYDSYGDDTTYKAALNYQVNKELLIRATYGTSFRAPDLYEQFLGDFTGFNSNLNDPCNQFGSNPALQPGDPVYDNCLAALTGIGLTEEEALAYRATSSILSVTSGASGLEAETSDSFTVGAVYTPEYADFSLALDYFDIQVENTISALSVGYALSQCYQSVNFSSPFCSRVGPREFATGGQLSFVDSSYVNIGEQRSRGYDLNFVFEHQFPSGKLTVDGIVTYLDKQSIDIFEQFVRLEGGWGFPRLTANMQVRYDWKDWRFGWFTNFIGESEEAPNFDPGTENIDRQNRSPNYLNHTASVRYSLANWDVIATVRNVFNKEPPYLGDQGSNGASRFYNTLPGVGYDLYGRTYVMQLSYRF